MRHELEAAFSSAERVQRIKECPDIRYGWQKRSCIKFGNRSLTPFRPLYNECPSDLCTQCAEGLQSKGREPLPARIRTIMAQYPRKRLRVLHAEVERELLWGGIGRVSQAFYHLAEDGTF